MDPFATLRKISDALEKVRVAEGKAALLEQVDGLRGALQDARETISELQDKTTSQREEILTLKTDLASRESWAAEATRYSLTKMDSGVLVYALKPEAADGEPEHQLCPRCFAQKHRHVLQRQASNQLWADEDVYRALYECPSCTSKYSFGTLAIPGPQAEHDRENAEYERALRTRSPITGY